MRLDKYLSHMGFGTRNDVKKLIKNGWVTINDEKKMIVFVWMMNP